jgi:hypothetical protein
MWLPLRAGRTMCENQRQEMRDEREEKLVSGRVAKGGGSMNSELQITSSAEWIFKPGDQFIDYTSVDLGAYFQVRSVADRDNTEDGVQPGDLLDTEGHWHDATACVWIENFQDFIRFTSQLAGLTVKVVESGKIAGTHVAAVIAVRSNDQCSQLLIWWIDAVKMLADRNRILDALKEA